MYVVLLEHRVYATFVGTKLCLRFRQPPEQFFQICSLWTSVILNYGDLLEERILPHSDTAMYSLTRFLPVYPSL